MFTAPIKRLSQIVKISSISKEIIAEQRAGTPTDRIMLKGFVRVVILCSTGETDDCKNNKAFATKKTLQMRPILKIYTQLACLR